MWRYPGRQCSASTHNEQIHLNPCLEMIQSSLNGRLQWCSVTPLSNWHTILVKVWLGLCLCELLVNLQLICAWFLFFFVISPVILNVWLKTSVFCFFLPAFPPCGSCPPWHGHHAGQEQRGQYPCVAVTSPVSIPPRMTQNLNIAIKKRSWIHLYSKLKKCKKKTFKYH